MCWPISSYKLIVKPSPSTGSPVPIDGNHEATRIRQHTHNCAMSYVTYHMSDVFRRMCNSPMLSAVMQLIDSQGALYLSASSCPPSPVDIGGSTTETSLAARRAVQQAWSPTAEHHQHASSRQHQGGTASRQQQTNLCPLVQEKFINSNLKVNGVRTHGNRGMKI